MVARVQDQGQTSEPFPVTNGTKQGCVMAPLLFTLVFSAMLNDAFHDNDLGALIRFRTDGNVFNLRRLKSRTRTSKLLIKDLLFADDCALLAHTIDENRGDVPAEAWSRLLGSNHHHRQQPTKRR